MTQINKHLLNLKESYLFSLIEEKVAVFKKNHPNSNVISLGVGDIAFPLAPVIGRGISEACLEMTQKPHGYSPATGLPFLIEKLFETEYKSYGISLDEICISEGINRDICDLGNLISVDQKVGIMDPTYPVYLKNSILSGKSNITLLPCREENGFVPLPPSEHLDVVYLCSPCNPTGIAMNRLALQKWVDYALREKAILLFDAAYAAFIRSSDVPKSIYEIEGAREVAIELRSFSKTAGFTGLRLGYTIVPKELFLYDGNTRYNFLHFWKMHQDIKTNGISYPIQKGGFAALSQEGKKETKAQIDSYLDSAKKIKETLEHLGYTCYGGVDSPYIWCKLKGQTSWEAFDAFLTNYQIVTIPGVGFGKEGEGFIRLSSFLTTAVTQAVVDRFLKKGAATCAMK